MATSMNGEGGPWQQTRTKRTVMITSVKSEKKNTKTTTTRKKADDSMFRI